MESAFHIGCSGYYYGYWRDRLYPHGLPPAQWLEYYSMLFDTVELNGTFYRMPRLSSLQRYAGQTPDDFSFSVKISKYITHILRLKDARTFVTEFQDLIKNGLGEKLSCFLFQLPPSFQFNEENLERVLTCVPRGYENVVEFRHVSWWNEIAAQALRDHQVTFCNVDFPGLSTYFMNTSPVFYLRLHGNPELFKSSYPEVDLMKFKALLPAGCDQYRVYFNNTYYEAGYENAASLMRIVSEGTCF